MIESKADKPYMPITDEELWGVPPGDLQEPEPTRNYFNENQPIISPQVGPGGQKGA